jgi:polar amino acid transport system substrate-binding protein
MRRTKVLVAAVLSPVVALGLTASAGAAQTARGTERAARAPQSGPARRAQPAGSRSEDDARFPSLGSCRTKVKHETYKSGQLTVATDNPAYSPWFEHNRPSDGKGYESAVAYEVGSLLGFKKSQVKWVTETFDNSYAPGPKAFDFDINEISITPARAKAVTFSIPYYKTTQSIVALKSNPIVKHHTPAALKTYLYGDQIGSTGLAYINSDIQPTRSPRVYNTLDEAIAALQTKQVDALVVDTPDGQYMASTEVKHGEQVGQFPAAATGTAYGLLFTKGNPLVSCVDSAIKTLTSRGTLAKLQKQYLAEYNNVPKLKP